MGRPKARKVPLGLRSPKTMPRQGRLGNRPRVNSIPKQAIAEAAKDVKKI